MELGLPQIKNKLTLLARNVSLLLLGITAATLATYAAIQNKIYWSGMTALITSNKEMDDLRKIVKSLEQSYLLIKVITETIKNEAK